MAVKYCSKCTTKCQPSAIRQLNTDLVGLLQFEIDVVLSNAYSTNLIGRQVKNSAKTDPEKATLLLNVITERMKTDPRTFDKFLDLLRSSSSLEHLATCLEEKVREFHQPDMDGEHQTPSRGDSGSSQAAATSKFNDPPSLSADDEDDDDHDQQPNGQQYQTRKKRPKKSVPSTHSQSKGATCGGQSKLEDTSEYESGVATASEQVPGDDETTVELGSAENFQVDGDVQPQAPGFPPQNQPDSEALSTVVDSVIPFAVQEQSMDQADPLIDECDQQPVPQCAHAQVSEQTQDDTSTLVHGTGYTDDNEDDWANRARYYVAVGAARESEKDKEIEDLNQEKAKLESELKEKEKKHAEAIKRKNEEHQKQVTELKLQLAAKENNLNTLQEKCTTEIKKIEDKFNQEKAQQEEELEEAKSEIESLKKQNSELEQNITEKAKAVEVQMQELEKLRESTQAKITELEANLKAKQEEIEKFEEKKKIEIGMIEEKFKEKISKLKYELECEKEAAKVREQLLESQSRVKWLEEEKKYIAEATKLKLRIEALGTRLAKEESEHLKTQNKQLTLEKVQSEVMLKEKLQQKDKQIQEKDEQLVQCMNEIKRLSLSSTSSSEASLNIGPRSSISDSSSQLQPVDEVVKFRFQESPDEFT